MSSSPLSNRNSMRSRRRWTSSGCASSSSAFDSALRSAAVGVAQHEARRGAARWDALLVLLEHAQEGLLLRPSGPRWRCSGAAGGRRVRRGSLGRDARLGRLCAAVAVEVRRGHHDGRRRLRPRVHLHLHRDERCVHVPRARAHVRAHRVVCTDVFCVSAPRSHGRRLRRRASAGQVRVQLVHVEAQPERRQLRRRAPLRVDGRAGTRRARGTGARRVGGTGAEAQARGQPPQRALALHAGRRGGGLALRALALHGGRLLRPGPAGLRSGALRHVLAHGVRDAPVLRQKLSRVLMTAEPCQGFLRRPLFWVPSSPPSLSSLLV
jgi:hypothetical protein